VNNTNLSSSVSIKAGESVPVVVKLSSNKEFSSGMSVEVRIHTAAGQEYPRTVVLTLTLNLFLWFYEGA